MRENCASWLLDKALCSQYNKAAASPDLGRQTCGTTRCVQPSGLFWEVRCQGGGPLVREGAAEGFFTALPAPQRFYAPLTRSGPAQILFSWLLRFLKKAPAPICGPGRQGDPRASPPTMSAPGQRAAAGGAEAGSRRRGTRTRDIPLFSSMAPFPRSGRGAPRCFGRKLPLFAAEPSSKSSATGKQLWQVSPRGPTSGQREKAKK